MSLIQIILVVAITWGVHRLLVGSSHYRLLILLLAVVAVSLVLFPGVSITLANTLGVGRGSDLVIYLSIVTLGMLWVRTYLRLRLTQQQITELARALALQTARDGQPSPSPTGLLDRAEPAALERAVAKQ